VQSILQISNKPRRRIPRVLFPKAHLQNSRKPVLRIQTNVQVPQVKPDKIKRPKNLQNPLNLLPKPHEPKNNNRKTQIRPVIFQETSKIHLSKIPETK
jgi:hypothetical protein